MATATAVKRPRHLRAVEDEPGNRSALRRRRALKKKTSRTWRYVTTKDQLKQVAQILNRYLDQRSGDVIPMFGVDLETYRPDGNQKLFPRAIWNGKDWEGRIRLLQIGLDPVNPEWKISGLQFTIDFDKLNEGKDDYYAEALVKTLLKPVLERATWLMQNGKYDLPFFQELLEITPAKVIDTMLISQTYWSGDRINHSLGDQYENFIGRVAPGLFKQVARPMFWYWYSNEEKWSKERFRAWYESTPEYQLFELYRGFKSKMQKSAWKSKMLTMPQLQYAADDVRLIFYLYECQQQACNRWIKENERDFPLWRGLAPINRLELAIMPIYAKMERYGIQHDDDYHRNFLIPFLDRKVEETRRECVKFDLLRRRRKKGHNSLLFVNLDGDPKFDTKPVKQLIKLLYPDIQELHVNKKSRGASTEITVSWFGGPGRKELLPIPRSIMLRENGWRFRDDRTIAINTDEVKGALEEALEVEVPDRKEKNLMALIDPDDPANPKFDILYAVLHFLKAFNYSSKYGRGFYKFIRSNHYAHPNWNQLGSAHAEIVSGRSSANDPAIMTIAARELLFAWYGKKGINAAKLFRPMWIADEGCVFVVADYGGIEPRYTAESTKDRVLRSVFLEGKDQHGLTAQFAWNALQKAKGGTDFWTEPPTGSCWQRDFGKIVNLGMTYGMGYRGLAEFMRWKLFGKMKPPTLEEAKVIWDAYWDLYSGVREAVDRLEAKLTAKLRRAGSLAPWKGRKPFAVAYTKMGRHRRFCLSTEQEKMPNHVLDQDFEGYWNGKYYSRNYNPFHQRLRDIRLKAFNHTIQGTCADMLKLAELYVDRAITKKGWDESKNHIKIVMHDELVVQCEEQYQAAMIKLVDRCMRRAAAKFLKVIPCEIAIGAGKNWYEAGAAAKTQDKKKAA